MGLINLVSPTGQVRAVDSGDDATLASLFSDRWTIEAPSGAAARGERAGKIEGYGIDTIAGKAKLAISEALGGITFGASTALEAQNPARREEMQLGREEHPVIAGVSNALGMVGPALLSGGAGAGGALARATPAGFAAKFGTRILESGAERGVAGRALAAGAAGIAEAVPASVGNYIASSAVEDKDLTAEGFWGATKQGLFFGGAGGAITSLTSSAAQAASRLFAKADVTEASAAAAERKSATAISDQLSDAGELDRRSSGYLRDHRHARVAVDPEAAQHAERVAIQASAPPPPDPAAVEAQIAKLQRGGKRPAPPTGGRMLSPDWDPGVSTSAAPAQPPLYARAVEIAKAAGDGGISRIQRALNIGHADASKIVAEMEARGIIAPPNEAGRRLYLGGGTEAPAPEPIERLPQGPQAPAEPWESPEAAQRAPATPVAEGDIIGEAPAPTATSSPTTPPDGGDDLLAKLAASSKRISAGEPIEKLNAETTAAAGRSKTWNRMLHPHIVGGGSVSDIEQQGWRAALADESAESGSAAALHGLGDSPSFDVGKSATAGAAPSGKMYMRRGKLVTEEEFTAGRAPRPPKSVDRQIDDAIADYSPEAAKVRDAADELAEARADVEHHLGAGAPAEPDLESLLGSSVERLKAGEPIGALAREAHPTVAAPPPPAADPAEAIARALRGRLDAPGDLAAGIPAIQRLEAAEANMVDALGPENAPAGAAARASAYREAQAAHENASSLAESQAAQAVNDAAPLPLATAQARSATTAHAEARAVNDAADALTADAPAAPAPAGGTARGVLGHVADAGAALEVLAALKIPGLPSARDIPVIGPILSLYLKARAASSVWRRLGGKIPGSVEGGVAARAAATRNRIAGAVRALSSGADRAARAVAPAAPLAAEVLARRMFGDEQDGRHRPNVRQPIGEMLADRADELERAQRPGAIAASLRDRVRTSDPELHQALVDGAQRRIDYLAAEMPRPPPGGDFASWQRRWQAPTSEVNRYARIVDALDDPAGVLERAVHGDISIDAMKAIRSVYPRLYAEAQGQLLEAVVDRGADIPYRRRLQLGILFGMPLDATQDPIFAAKQQAGLAPPAPAPQAAPPQIAINGPLDLSSGMMLQEMR